MKGGGRRGRGRERETHHSRLRIQRRCGWGEVEEHHGNGGLVGLAEAADVLEDVVAVALDDVFYTR
jgi:hypothetical protein